VEQLGDRVGPDAGVALDRPSRLRRRCHREHDTALGAQIVGGGREHAGLAGTGRADHQHQPIVPGDRGRGVGLQRIQALAADRGRRCGWVGLGGHRPRQDRFFLSEDRLGREAGGGRLDPHRPTIRVPSGRVAVRVEVDELVEDVVGGSLDGGGPAVSRLLRHGSL
jgi:hypothetical protein